MNTFLPSLTRLGVIGALVWMWMAYASIASAYSIEQVSVSGVTEGDFVVGPTKTDVTLEPGTERVVELMVTNRMGERKVFNLFTEDMTGSNDPTQTVVLLGDDRGPYSLKDYLKIPEMSFELNSGERARIPVTIAIPQDAQPGGLYGSVLVTTTSVPSPEDDAIKAGSKAGSVIISRIGALFFVTIPGAVEKSGELATFTTIPEGKNVFSNGPIAFQLLYRNTGSVHLNPYGVITIKNMFGKEVGTVTADPWFAMPQSTRLRELSWNRPYLFGYYTAEARIFRGYDDKVDTATLTFMVIPWKLLGLAFVGLVILLFVLRTIVRTFEIKRK